MTTHERLCAALRKMEQSAMTTDELVAACKSKVPQANTADIITALYAIGNELMVHGAWILSGRITH